MPIITISRGSYSHGREVAERLCAQLGYRCLSREILLEASEQFNTPEIKMASAIHDAPSILERFTYGKEKYIAYFREALLRHFLEDNIIYHGLAGEFFVKGIPHVLKVRILADIKDRIALERMNFKAGSEDQIARQLEKDDEQRRRWSQHLYGIDTREPTLYDLVIHIGRVGVDEAVGIIAETAAMDCFQSTEESRKQIALHYKAARAQAALVQQIPSAKVDVEEGELVVSIQGHGDFMGDDRKLTAQIEEIVDEKGDVKVKVRLTNR
ncbi:MAG: AAA family ATPase [Syntrophobacteraceae bacterium]